MDPLADFNRISAWVSKKEHYYLAGRNLVKPLLISCQHRTRRCAALMGEEEEENPYHHGN